MSGMNIVKSCEDQVQRDVVFDAKVTEFETDLKKRCHELGMDSDFEAIIAPHLAAVHKALGDMSAKLNSKKQQAEEKIALESKAIQNAFSFRPSKSNSSNVNANHTRMKVRATSSTIKAQNASALIKVQDPRIAGFEAAKADYLVTKNLFGLMNHAISHPPAGQMASSLRGSAFSILLSPRLNSLSVENRAKFDLLITSFSPDDLCTLSIGMKLTPVLCNPTNFSRLLKLGISLKHDILQGDSRDDLVADSFLDYCEDKGIRLNDISSDYHDLSGYMKLMADSKNYVRSPVEPAAPAVPEALEIVASESKD